MVVDVDGALCAQPYLRGLMAEGRAFKVEARDLAPKLRIVASKMAAAELRERLENVWRDDEPMLVFYGSGDFHHLCTLFLALAAEPVNVVQFDNHPDWTDFPKTLNCGSWVNRALELDHVEKVIAIGPSSDDFVKPEAKSANLQAIRDGRLEVYPWRAAPSRLKGKPVNAPCCRTEDGHIVWSQLEGRRFEDFVDELDERLSDRPLWITLDKDVLRRREAATNWDQSKLTLDQVLLAVRRLSKRRRIVGADVCGDYSRGRYGDLFRIFLDLTDHPRIKRPGARRLAINDRTNARLVEAFGSLLP